MQGPAPLPRLMVAPNGARRTKADHPALPITDDEIAATARACQDAGANGIHLHLRDAEGGHLLDAGRYRALLAQVAEAAPGMFLQVTSEAAGRYGAEEQIAMIRALRPASVSVALREIVRQPEDWPAAREFYRWAAEAGVGIQHIAYTPQELRAFVAACREGNIPGTHHALQIVLGSYAGAPSRPEDLAAYTDVMDAADGMTFDWMLCAFGAGETPCLAAAVRAGGKARVGFENSLLNADGSRATDNAERVREVAAAIRRGGPVTA